MDRTIALETIEESKADYRCERRRRLTDNESAPSTKRRRVNECGSDCARSRAQDVREIVRLRPITPVPRVPAAIPGVISLRGEVVEVLDLRMRLGLPSQAPSRASRIVVLHGDDGAVTGLLVDAVRDVLRIPEDQLRSSAGGDNEAVSALLVRGDEFVSLLDLDRVLDLGE